jgi:hypothetical protein
VIHTLGASKILACAQPRVPIGYQSVFAWYTGIKIGVLYINPKSYATLRHPTVDFFPLRDGWRVFPSHMTAATVPHCHGLRLTYRS